MAHFGGPRFSPATFVVAVGASLAALTARPAEPPLIAHWPLSGDAREVSGTELRSEVRGIDFNAAGPTGSPRTAARFRGRGAVIEVADPSPLRLDRDPFSVSLWVHVDQSLDGTPGDLISHYDSERRTGFHLGIYSHGGVTSSQPNERQLHFGIDQGRIEEQFTDHGVLGTAVLVFALCVHEGRLYAATCHAGADEAGRVFRFEGGDRWTDLGSPDAANAVSAMAVFNGSLYVASSKYRLAGSALPESENPHVGGRVFRLGEQDQWLDCGRLSEETEAVGSLIVFRGELYAGSLYRPAGFFRYGGGRQWTACPTPDGKRVEALTVFRDAIYATSYDEGSVFRYDGRDWERVGTIPDATQTYGFGIHRGELYVSQWPQARVHRYASGTHWVDTGRLGDELESMPLLVYNGKLYAGTLPLAEIYRFDGMTQWTRLGAVDQTPDVRYRRAWSMAVYQGRLFVGTLPSGRVLSIEAGRNVTWDHAFPGGWNHIAAVREPDRLRLYVNGREVGASAPFAAESYCLDNRQPLYLGGGAQEFFRGALADVRIYRGALSAEQVRQNRHHRACSVGR
jgi:hypothetical protein